MVQKNQAAPGDIAKLITAAIAVAVQLKTGTFQSSEILPLIEQTAPEAIPVLELVANILFPGAGTLIEVTGILAQLLFVGIMLSPIEKKTLQERLVDPEAAWMNRQNAT